MTITWNGDAHHLHAIHGVIYLIEAFILEQLVIRVCLGFKSLRRSEISESTGILKGPCCVVWVTISCTHSTFHIFSPDVWLHRMLYGIKQGISKVKMKRCFDTDRNTWHTWHVMCCYDLESRLGCNRLILPLSFWTHVSHASVQVQSVTQVGDPGIVHTVLPSIQLLTKLMMPA